MIKETFVYSIVNMTKYEKGKLEKFVRNMISRCKTGKTFILAVPNYAFVGDIFILTISYKNSCANMRAAVLGGINKSLGAGRAC